MSSRVRSHLNLIRINNNNFGTYLTIYFVERSNTYDHYRNKCIKLYYFEGLLFFRIFYIVRLFL